MYQKEDVRKFLDEKQISYEWFDHKAVFTIDEMLEIGLEKEDRNIPSYQIVADVLERLDIHSGTVFNYHQERRQTKNYLADLELLQYDIMYGEQYVYNGNPPITETIK